MNPWLSKALTYAPKVYDVIANIVEDVKRRRRERAAAERAASDAEVMARARKAADDAREKVIMDHWAEIDRRKPR